MVDDKKQDAAGAGAANDQKSIDVRDLLGGRRELRLEHKGQIYRLRITQNGKLILTK